MDTSNKVCLPLYLRSSKATLPPPENALQDFNTYTMLHILRGLTLHPLQFARPHRPSTPHNVIQHTHPRARAHRLLDGALHAPRITGRDWFVCVAPQGAAFDGL